MTSLETSEILFQVERKTLTDCIVAAVEEHTHQFGSEYLYEVLRGLSVICNSDDTQVYERHEFSDPESNFRLELIDE